MSAFRVIGAGLGCATFAAAGAFLGSEIGEKVGEGKYGMLESAVGGAMIGSALGALITGMLAGASVRVDPAESLRRISGVGCCGNSTPPQNSTLQNPRFP